MSKRSPIKRFQGYLNSLNRRLDFLKDRIAKNEDRDNSYDRAEFDAIRWALEVVERYPFEALAVVKSVPDDRSES